MRLRVKFKIALRYLLARKSHSAVNVISVVSMAGIALATAALVVVMSVFNGFHNVMESRLSVLEAPLRVTTASGKALERADSLARALEATGEFAIVAPAIEERALAVTGRGQMAVRLRGTDPRLYGMFDSVCIAGEPWADFHPLAPPAVLSVGAANGLEAPIGGEQLMRLYVPRRKGRINPAAPMSAFRADSAAISAVYSLNQPELDNDIVYVPLAMARELLQYDSTRASYLELYPKGGTASAAKAAAAVIDPELRVRTAAELHAASFHIVNMEKWLTFLLLGFILAIAGFNIISTLALLAVEKRENARTLEALGATSRDIRSIYRLLGILTTSLGGIAGMTAGTLLSLGQQHYGWVKLAGDASQLSLTSYPVYFRPDDLIAVALSVIAVGLLSSLAATRKL